MQPPIRPPSRAALRQARTRADLIAAATEIIATRGVDGLRVGDITGVADVAFGTFYNHFKTKDDVVEAVVAVAIEKLARSIEESPAFTDPHEALAASTLAVVRIAYEDSPLARLVVNLEQAEARFERILRPRATAILQRGIDAGVFAIGDLETTLTMMVAAAFEVIRKIVEDRLPDRADATCAEQMLRMAGVESGRAAEIVRVVTRPHPA